MGGGRFYPLQHLWYLDYSESTYASTNFHKRSLKHNEKEPTMSKWVTLEGKPEEPSLLSKQDMTRLLIISEICIKRACIEVGGGGGRLFCQCNPSAQRGNTAGSLIWRASLHEKLAHVERRWLPTTESYCRFTPSM